MSEWTSIAQPMRYVVELDAPLTVRRERGVLVQGDKDANAFVLDIYQSKGVAADLTGCTVTLTFVRPDRLSPLPIKATIEGNVAVATLTESCYRVSGAYGAMVTLAKDGVERTILKTIGDMICTGSDGVVDEEQIFPTPEELIEMLAQAEQARDNANAAASSATTAAGKANSAATSATTAAGNANSAASSANAAAVRAENAAQNWESSTAADAEKLGGKLPAAYVQSVSGVLPDSAGNVPYAVAKYYPTGTYVEGGNGDADYITDPFALVPIGSTENPDLSAALGSETGYAYVHTYFYRSQNAAQNRYQTAVSYYRSEQPRMAYRTYVNGVWGEWTRGIASDSDKLGGKAPEHYKQLFNLLDNSDFTNPVNERGYVSGTALAAYAYFIDRWAASSQGLTPTLSDAGLTIPVNNGAVQYLDPLLIRRLVGETVTLAAWMSDGTVMACSGTFTQGSTWTRMCFVSQNNFTITLVDTGSGAAYVMAQTEADAANAKTIQQMALYQGAYTAETLPPYVPKGYAVELAQCQRYYLARPTASAWNTAENVVTGYLVIRIPTPSTMRVKPSIIKTGDGLEIYTGGWTKIDESLFNVMVHKNEVVLALRNTELPDIALEGGKSYLINYVPSLSADV